MNSITNRIAQARDGKWYATQEDEYLDGSLIQGVQIQRGAACDVKVIYDGVARDTIVGPFANEEQAVQFLESDLESDNDK